MQTKLFYTFLFIWIVSLSCIVRPIKAYSAGSDNSSIKAKEIVKGKKHGTGMFLCNLSGDTQNDTFGYEFHAGKNKEIILDEIGIYSITENNSADTIAFNVMVYDMGESKKSPTQNFHPILETPIKFEYSLAKVKDGVYRFPLQDKVTLPQNALVVITCGDNLGNHCLWFRCNGLGGKIWYQTHDGVLWDRMPISAPFYVKCLEYKRK